MAEEPVLSAISHAQPGLQHPVTFTAVAAAVPQEVLHSHTAMSCNSLPQCVGHVPSGCTISQPGNAVAWCPANSSLPKLDLAVLCMLC